MGKKLGLISLGCPKNLVDSEVMLGLAEEAGHTFTADPREAEVLVVNTCAFIDSAKQESIDAILEMAQHKREGRCRRLVVTGCLAERYRDELRVQMPEIDVVLGTGEVPGIVAAIDGQRRDSPAAGSARPATFFRSRGDLTSTSPAEAGSHGRGRAGRPSTTDYPPTTIDHRLPPTWLYDADTPRVLATPGHYAYVKVAEGCDYRCAFCIIPKLRGSYRSRTPESILQEAASLAARGVKELLLISQDTTFYGIDRGERGALGRLIRQLDRVEGLRWIRLLYLYPTTIHDDTLAAIAESEKVCKYVDLPLQHASDAVLKRMKRPGTRRGYERLIERIRTRIPGVTLRTTFIVGFPGETGEDFAQLQEFVGTLRFDHVGVFTYSHEEGTSAYRLGDDVPAKLKRQRRQSLMAQQKRLVREANRRRLGTTVEVLVDGPAPEHEMVLRGRLGSQAPDIDPVVYLDHCTPTDFRCGDFVTATVTGSKDYDLLAQPVALR